VLLDTWHFFRSGEPWDLLRSLDAEQIAIVHADDAPAMASDDLVYETRQRRVPIGSGTFAIAEFATAIDSLGYRGVISAEVLSTTFRATHPVEGARTLMDAFRTHWPAV
jgi:sugar phosphate isomerase/epimerase